MNLRPGFNVTVTGDTPIPPGGPPLPGAFDLLVVIAAHKDGTVDVTRSGVNGDVWRVPAKTLVRR